MKIAILGTRGIPNNYGGFEQFAEYLSVGLAKRGHNVAVYNPHFHERAHDYHGVRLIHKYSPERFVGSAANFVYDYLCLKDALHRGFDIVLECGYQSSAISFYLCNINRSIIVTNMDGMEWWRAKWGPAVRRLTRWFEKLAVSRSHCLVADNVGIQRYLMEAYGADARYIPYGSDVVERANEHVLSGFGLRKRAYSMLLARLEAENNIDDILSGYAESSDPNDIIVVGNHETRYGRYLSEKYGNIPKVRFLGSIYNKEILDGLRKFAKVYFHGHSVGGTNPSLLEAMSCGALIAAHENIFNRSVLGEDALYFSTANEVKMIVNDGIKTIDARGLRETWSSINIGKIGALYSWESIVDRYERLFLDLLHSDGRP